MLHAARLIQPHLTQTRHMAVQTLSPVLKPLVAVIGTTGTGKSQLAIELALALARVPEADGCNEVQLWKGGEVINADAMQAYEGLDIVTNKVTEDEKRGIPHHLMGVRKPGQEYYISEWIKDATEAIDKCHQNGKIPIVTGGTSYWIQHLLFPNRLVSLGDTQNATPPGHGQGSEPFAKPIDPSLQAAVDSLEPELSEMFRGLPPREGVESCSSRTAFALHSLLSRVDPLMGARWHWRDSRKVLRSLEIIRETGRRASDIMIEQSQAEQVPKYQSIVFWLYAEPEKLDPRLDSRVDDMMNRGMLGEILAMRRIAAEMHSEGKMEDPPTPEAAEADFTRGIFQAIGYKEFHDYLSQPPASRQLLLGQSVDQTKLSTRKYARYQIKWIRNKLLPALRSQTPGPQAVSLFLLDATDLAGWSVEVFENAERILRRFLRNERLGEPGMLSKTAERLLSGSKKAFAGTASLEIRKKRVCDVCSVEKHLPVMIEEGEQWSSHVRTKAHRNRAGREARIAEQMAMKEVKQQERLKKRLSAESLADSPPTR